jgi:Spy/CpxP family protein refolding chaperone
MGPGMMGGYGGHGMGPGTAGGYGGHHMGPGMMGGYGGHGMGPGTAGGYGGHHMGPGMMGGYGGHGMGPGTAGGYGGHHMGPGMMGGYGGHGMGLGMMGGYGLGAIYRLNLTDEQRTQVNGVQDDLRKKNWDLMGKMQDELSKQADIRGSSGKLDRSAILAADKRIFELRQQMLANGLDAQERIEALLTPQQKEQYRELSQSRLDNDSY